MAVDAGAGRMKVCYRRAMDGDKGGQGRRRFLKILLGAPAAFAIGMRLFDRDEMAMADTLLAAASPESGPSRSGRALAPTPDCGDDDEPTPAMTEGPFFTPRSPLRVSLLEPGITGTRVFLTGRVFSSQCQPVPGALLDFWHADDAGEYDNVGYRLRGHQFTDDQGRYRLATIVPGLYPGRTRHYHLKVQAPKGRILTTQLFFPGEPRNRVDGLFRRDLLMSVKDTRAGKDARFNVVLGEG
jgi:protocatechuate 3,4-dioxygenase beta subunit